MSEAWVVDSNLYVDAIRTPAAADELAAFESRAAPFLFMHSTVAQEVLAGARDEATWHAFQQALVAPFEELGRIVTPTHATWKQAALVMTRLVEARRMSPGGFTRSFMNDCLIAASAVESGLVVVTRNVRDFGLIREVEPALVFEPPWP